MAEMIWSSVQLPNPVSLSGVRFGPAKTPSPGIANPTSEPPSMRDKSGLPRKEPGVWQSLQPPIVARDLPRAISLPSASAAEDVASVAAATSKAFHPVRMFPPHEVL